MRTRTIEVYSDASNAAVMRHPERRFPGVLIQGDTLHSMCMAADTACKAAHGNIGEDEYEELDALRNQLQEYLMHYKSVLGQHGIDLPFGEPPNA